MNGFDSVVVNEKKETGPGKWEIRLSVPASSPYFKGHFPSFHLLPAVATVDIVALLSSDILGRKISVTSISRTKFTSPLLPDEEAALSLDLSRSGSVVFSVSLKGRECSKGILRYAS